MPAMPETASLDIAHSSDAAGATDEAAGTLLRQKRDFEHSLEWQLTLRAEKRLKCSTAAANRGVLAVLQALAELGLAVHKVSPLCIRCEAIADQDLAAYLDRLPEMTARTARILASARNNDIYRASHRSKNEE